MINDLTGRGEIVDSADFIVIGAGTVGLPASLMLTLKTGKKIICLESGGTRQDTDTHTLNQVVHLATEYRGASDGRFRCMGGTSTRWGGALIPFQSKDIEIAGWPLASEDLEPYIPDVEALFGLEPGPYYDPAFPFGLGDHHVNRLAKWPAFKKRNVANLLGGQVSAEKNLELWLNAHVTDIRLDSKRVQVVASSIQGDEIRLSAEHLIIAAGAIEATRLALLIDQRHDAAISKSSPDLGHYFSDHISTEVAEIASPKRNALNKIIGFRFGALDNMRNIRFELAPDSLARQSLPPSFIHIGFEVDRPGGFDALREILRYAQMKRIPPVRVVMNLMIGAPWLIRAIWWRFVQKRLLFPTEARLVAHAVIEQKPIRGNYIALSKDKVDQFGVPLAEICWNITESDTENLLRSAALFKETWDRSGLSASGTWTPIEQKRIQEKLHGSGGIFHPTGSTRMGYEKTDGVVDKDLKLFAFPQVQILSTSVLPTGGGANPTMMLMLLAMRCVAQHARS